MKKLLTAALLALVVSGLSAPSSQAGSFGLFYHHHCGCCGGCTFCVRPYNAFSPVCSGCITCDGCMPFSSGCGPGGCPTLNYSGLPACGDGGGCFGQLPPAEGQLVAPPDATANSQPQVPTTMAGTGYQGMYSAGYRPAFYPGHGYGPQGAAAAQPAYWNNR
jgi:hypothetical protein